MKRTVLTGMFLTAALMGSQAFAADDLCGTNIVTLSNATASTNTNMDADAQKGLEKTITEAKAAQASGDTKKCIEITTKQITEMKTMGSGSEGAK